MRLHDVNQRSLRRAKAYYNGEITKDERINEEILNISPSKVDISYHSPNRSISPITPVTTRLNKSMNLSKSPTKHDKSHEILQKAANSVLTKKDPFN